MDLFRLNKGFNIPGLEISCKAIRRIVNGIGISIYKIILFISFLIAFSIISCSSGSSYPILSFFFDGVPEPERRKTVQADSLQNFIPRQKTARTSQDSTATTLNLIIHPDYQKKACDKCHELEHSYRLKQGQPQLCYQCHIPFESKYKQLHGPVAAGFCLTCHEPHKSNNKALAKMPVHLICRHCHDPGDVNKNEAHKKASNINCLQCHNAHGGDTAHLLKKD